MCGKSLFIEAYRCTDTHWAVMRWAVSYPRKSQMQDRVQSVGQITCTELERRKRRTLTTRELALLCSYARSAPLTSGRLDTRERDFHSSPSVGSGGGMRPSSSSRTSSSISDGDGRDGEDVAEVIESAGVVWNAARGNPCVRVQMFRITHERRAAKRREARYEKR